MPTYEYKGYQFKSDKDLSEDEFAATLAHLDTLPPKQASVSTQASLGIPDSTPMPGSGPVPEPSFGEKLYGAGEAATSLISGLPGMVAGPLMGIQARVAGASPKEAEQVAAQQMENMTFQPRTEAGKEYSGAAGEFINRYVLPVAPMLHTLPAIKAGEATNAMKAKFTKEAPKPSTALEGIKAELSAPEQAPMSEAGAGAFQNITDRLGYKEGENTPLRTQTPIQDVAGQLTKAGEESRGATAQEALATRETAMQQEMAQRVAREQEAKLRGEQENAPVYSPEHLKMMEEQAKHEATVKTEELHQQELTKAHEQALAEQQRIAEAQAAVEARQAALERSVEAAGDAAKARTALVEQAGVRADLEKRSPFSKAYKEEQAAKAAEEAATKQAAEVKTRRAENEALIQKLRDEHAASQERSAKAQEVLNKRVEEQRLETQKQTTLDFNAAERARQEAGTLPPAIGPLKPAPLGSKARAAGKQGKKSQRGGILVNWGSKNSGIKGPIGDILKNIGNALIKSPEDAIKFASNASDVAQNTLQKGINALTKGGTYLKGKVNNPVVHYTVDRLLGADNLAKAEISAKLHGEYLPVLRDLTDAQRLDAFELLNTADLNKKVLTEAMMLKHGVDPKVINFVATHQKMMGEALAKINAARAAVGKKPIEAREAYSAMSTSGDYRKVAYKTIDGEKRVVGVISSNTRAAKLGSSLDKIQAEMLKRDPTLEFGPLQDMTQRKSAAAGTPHEAFQNALETLGESSPHIQAFLDTLKEVAKDDAKNYLGMQTHTMQKKGVWGMEGRKQWLSPEENMKAFFENQVNYLEGSFRWSHLAEAAKDVNTVLRDKGVIDKHGNAIKLSEEYMQNALGLNPSRVGKALENVFNSLFSSDMMDKMGVSPSRVREGLGYAKAGLNTSMLSLNPSFLAIQLIQGGTAMPAMTALLRGRGLAPKSTILTGGLDAMAKGGITFMKELTGNVSGLSAVEKGALQFAKDNHVYATDMVEHTNQINKGGKYYTTKVTQSPAASIETATRGQVFLAFVHMMDESGLKPADGLFEQAHRMTDMTMNNYGAIEKPAFYNALGPVGSMAYNLKSFGHNEISRWSMFAREAKSNGNYVPLLTQMATTIAVAGVMGLPFYSQWESLYDLITAKLGEPRSLALDVMEASQKLGEHIPQLGEFTLSHGAPTLFGADVSKRIGLGDVLPSKAADVAFAGGSKGVDMVSKLIGAAANPDEAHSKAAFLAWMPPIIQAPLKEHWYTKNGLAYTMDPDKPPVATAELNARDTLLKKIGVVGINESSQKEKYFQQNKVEKAYNDIKQKGLTIAAQDLFHGKDISERAMRLFLKGQGDPTQLQQNIMDMAIKQGMTQEQLKILKDSSSRSITKMYDLERRTQ